MHASFSKRSRPYYIFLQTSIGPGSQDCVTSSSSLVLESRTVTSSSSWVLQIEARTVAYSSS